VSHRPPRLITELIALVKEWGWTVQDLARELKVHRTTLLHQRSGRHALPTPMLSRIAKRFRNDRTVRDLVWHYLTVEYEEHPSTVVLPPVPRVEDAVAAILRGYIARFGDESIHGGRGLYLVGPDANALSAALLWLRNAFKEHRIESSALRADRAVTGADVRYALAVPVLLIERVDFLGDAVAEVIRRRADLVRPMIVTSMQPPSAITDARLRRILASMCRVVEFGPAPTPTPPPHAVPAKPEQQ
jgi:hypothetical protein